MDENEDACFTDSDSDESVTDQDIDLLEQWKQQQEEVAAREGEFAEVRNATSVNSTVPRGACEIICTAFCEQITKNNAEKREDSTVERIHAGQKFVIRTADQGKKFPPNKYSGLLVTRLDPGSIDWLAEEGMCHFNMYAKNKKDLEEARFVDYVKNNIKDGDVVIIGVNDTACAHKNPISTKIYEALKLLGAPVDVENRFPFRYRQPWCFCGQKGSKPGDAKILTANRNQEMKFIVKFRNKLWDGKDPADRTALNIRIDKKSVLIRDCEFSEFLRKKKTRRYLPRKVLDGTGERCSRKSVLDFLTTKFGIEVSHVAKAKFVMDHMIGSHDLHRFKTQFNLRDLCKVLDECMKLEDFSKVTNKQQLACSWLLYRSEEKARNRNINAIPAMEMALQYLCFVSEKQRVVLATQWFVIQRIANLVLFWSDEITERGLTSSTDDHKRQFLEFIRIITKATVLMMRDLSAAVVVIHVTDTKVELENLLRVTQRLKTLCNEVFRDAETMCDEMITAIQACIPKIQQTLPVKVPQERPWGTKRTADGEPKPDSPHKPRGPMVSWKLHQPKVITESDGYAVILKTAGYIVQTNALIEGLTAESHKTLYSCFAKNMDIQMWLHSKECSLSKHDFCKQLQLPDSNKYYPSFCGLVQRLNRMASGVMLVATNPRTFLTLRQQGVQHKWRKHYLCLVYGRIPLQNSISDIDAPLLRESTNSDIQEGAQTLRVRVEDCEGDEAKTFYKVERYFKRSEVQGCRRGFTLVKCVVHHGRAHQVRVHMGHVGFPVVGDKAYNPREYDYQLTKSWCPRMFLHLQRIDLPDPADPSKTVSHSHGITPDLEEILAFLDSDSDMNTKLQTHYEKPENLKHLKIFEP